LPLKQLRVIPITTLAFVLTISDLNRFKHSNQLTSYVELIPREHSFGGKHRLEANSKHGATVTYTGCCRGIADSEAAGSCT
jgi:transposase